MDLGLAGRRALVTGAGSGIGRAIALALAAEGVAVAVNDVDAAGVQATVAMAREAGAQACAAVFDISSLEAVQDGVAAAAQKCGGSIDVLVNNAAVLAAHAPFLETDPADWRREIDVILIGTLNCARAVLPGMVAAGGGKIVNVVTDAARVGQEREVTYSAAKGGVISFTRSIAREVGPAGVNVNAVSPAATNSPMRQKALAAIEAKIGAERLAEREVKVRRAYPMRRIGEPEDIAATVVFLCSAPARHITGQILSVNGGYAMVG
ncbi:MAG: SDR family NAD(P)-dependent oxidoreductase [Pseudomonadota bacterium]|jgi:2-hydroxycyclohexanecarboxyl-CoA dehydrogenase